MKKPLQMKILKILIFTATFFTQIQAPNVEKQHNIKSGNSHRLAQPIPNPHIVNLQNAFPANGFYQYYYSVPKHQIRPFLPNGVIPTVLLPPSAPGTGVFLPLKDKKPGTGFFTRQIDKDPLKKPSKSIQIYKQKEPQTNGSGSSQGNRSEVPGQQSPPNTKKSDHRNSMQIPLIHGNHPPVPPPMAQSVVPVPTVVNDSSQTEEADSFDLEALPDVSVFYDNEKAKAENGEKKDGIGNHANIKRNTLFDGEMDKSA